MKCFFDICSLGNSGLKFTSGEHDLSPCDYNKFTMVWFCFYIWCSLHICIFSTNSVQSELAHNLWTEHTHTHTHARLYTQLFCIRIIFWTAFWCISLTINYARGWSFMCEITFSRNFLELAHAKLRYCFLPLIWMHLTYTILIYKPLTAFLLIIHMRLEI